MKEARYFYVPQADVETELPAEEAQHAVRVLRLKEGDEIFLMDGDGSFYRAEVTLAAARHCGYAIREHLPQSRQWTGHVHLAVAPTKMIDRVEWMLEKVVEAGVDRVSFLDCQFSERRVLKTERLEKIAVAAMKQSRKAWKTQLSGLQQFSQFLQEQRQGRRFIAHCYDEIPRSYLFDELLKPGTDDKGEDITVLVGPEGDFSIDEVRQALKAGYVSVHLGRSRLRTETAGLAAVMMTQISKEYKLINDKNQKV